MSQETERKQGIFVIAAFDRMFARERKNQDGTFSKTHYVGLIIRSDTRNPPLRSSHKTSRKVRALQTAANRLNASVSSCI